MVGCRCRDAADIREGLKRVNTSSHETDGNRVDVKIFFPKYVFKQYELNRTSSR